MSPTESSPTPGLDLGALPDLPQSQRVRELSLHLWERPDVRALWLGGSLAAGRGDRYSDIDYRVAVRDDALAAWQHAEPSMLPWPWLVSRRVPFGDAGVLHQLMLEDAELLDLVVWRESSVHLGERVIALGCRSEALRARLDEQYEEPETPFPRVDPDVMRRLIEDYWVLTSKARKGQFRELLLLEHIGVHFERMLLLRLMYVLETGLDCGDPGRGAIHALSPVVRRVAASRPEAMELLGAGLESQDAVRKETGRHHELVAALGRQLAERLGFDYPAAAERATRAAWSRFTRTP